MENTIALGSISKYLFLLLAFIGANGCSLGGGVKCFRFILLIKFSFWQANKILYPKRIIPIKLNKQVVPDEIIQGVFAFYFIAIFSIIILTVLTALSQENFYQSMRSVIFAFSNIGSLEAQLNTNKIILIIAMLLGKLELFPFIILFTPMFWKK
jgi:trk system potassium uptake protein TrkH